AWPGPGACQPRPDGPDAGGGPPARPPAPGMARAPARPAQTPQAVGGPPGAGGTARLRRDPGARAAGAAGGASTMSVEAGTFVVVLVTAGSAEEGRRIGRAMVEERLGARRNVGGPTPSVLRGGGGGD